MSTYKKLYLASNNSSRKYTVSNILKLYAYFKCNFTSEKTILEHFNIKYLTYFNFPSSLGNRK